MQNSYSTAETLLPSPLRAASGSAVPWPLSSPITVQVPLIVQNYTNNNFYDNDVLDVINTDYAEELNNISLYPSSTGVTVGADSSSAAAAVFNDYGEAGNMTHTIDSPDFAAFVQRCTASHRVVVKSAPYGRCMEEQAFEALVYESIAPGPFAISLVVAHIFVFLVGLIGNAMVFLAIKRHRSMRTVINHYIVNLAIADFAVLVVCLPPTVIWDVLQSWLFGNITCKVVLYLQFVCVTVSILTLTTISIDRWLAIVRPLQFRRSRRKARRVIIVIWAISCLVNIPVAVVYQSEENGQIIGNTTPFLNYCAPWSPFANKIFDYSWIMLFYLLPLVAMTVAYTWMACVLWRSPTSSKASGLIYGYHSGGHGTAATAAASASAAVACAVNGHVSSNFHNNNSNSLRKQSTFCHDDDDELHEPPQEPQRGGRQSAPLLGTAALAHAQQSATDNDEVQLQPQRRKSNLTSSLARGGGGVATVTAAAAPLSPSYLYLMHYSNSVKKNNDKKNLTVEKEEEADDEQKQKQQNNSILIEDDDLVEYGGGGGTDDDRGKLSPSSNMSADIIFGRSVSYEPPRATTSPTTESKPPSLHPLHRPGAAARRTHGQRQRRRRDTFTDVDTDDDDDEEVEVGNDGGENGEQDEFHSVIIFNTTDAQVPSSSLKSPLPLSPLVTGGGGGGGCGTTATTMFSNNNISKIRHSRQNSTSSSSIIKTNRPSSSPTPCPILSPSAAPPAAQQQQQQSAARFASLRARPQRAAPLMGAAMAARRRMVLAKANSSAAMLLSSSSNQNHLGTAPVVLEKSARSPRHLRRQQQRISSPMITLTPAHSVERPTFPFAPSLVGVGVSTATATTTYAAATAVASPAAAAAAAVAASAAAAAVAALRPRSSFSCTEESNNTTLYTLSPTASPVHGDGSGGGGNNNNNNNVDRRAANCGCLRRMCTRMCALISMHHHHSNSGGRRRHGGARKYNNSNSRQQQQQHAFQSADGATDITRRYSDRSSSTKSGDSRFLPAAAAAAAAAAASPLEQQQQQQQNNTGTPQHLYVRPSWNAAQAAQQRLNGRSAPRRRPMSATSSIVTYASASFSLPSPCKITTVATVATVDGAALSSPPPPSTPAAAAAATVPPPHLPEDQRLQSRRNAAKMLIAVAALFAICYFPVHLLTILRNITDLPDNQFWSIFSLVSHWLCYAQSASNPIIYNIMNRHFRRAFRELLTRICHRESSSSSRKNSHQFAAAGGGGGGGNGNGGLRKKSSVKSRDLSGFYHQQERQQQQQQQSLRREQPNNNPLNNNNTNASPKNTLSLRDNPRTAGRPRGGSAQHSLASLMSAARQRL